MLSGKILSLIKNYLTLCLCEEARRSNPVVEMIIAYRKSPTGLPRGARNDIAGGGRRR